MKNELKSALTDKINVVSGIVGGIAISAGSPFLFLGAVGLFAYNLVNKVQVEKTSTKAFEDIFLSSEENRKKLLNVIGEENKHLIEEYVRIKNLK